MAQVKFVKGNITGTDSTYLRLETGNIEFDSNRRQILLDGVSYGESIPLLTDTRTSAAATITTSTSQIRQLYDGARVSIRLALNTAASTSLNLTLSNGTTTGAIPVYVVSATSNMARMAASLGRTGMILDLVYDSANNRWIQVGNTDKNSTYTNVSLGNGYAIQNNSSASSAITATLSSYTLTAQGRVSVKFNYDVPAGATLNINGKGAKPIYYSGSAIGAGTLKSGDIATFVYNGTNYELVSKYTSGLTFDTVPTENSTNPVTSGGLYTVITENEEITAAALNDLNNHKVNTEDLATVATTGSYNDLTDKPNIPVGPMVFKGSLGTGGTITTLPTASSDNIGYTYKVITDGTYASQSAKAGDTFVSDGSTWILIPSGDEPAGTVTSVGMTVPTGLSVTPNSSNPITSSGTFAISYASGYSIPTTAKQTSWDNKISSVKTLNTNNTTAQTASASETLSGSGTINLHKVSKTGDYKDLLGVTTYTFSGGTEDTTNHCKTITSSPVGSFDEAKTKIQNGEDVYISWGSSKRIPLHINGRYTNGNEESLVAISQDFIFEWQNATTAKVWEIRYVTDSDLTEVQDFLQDQIDGIILEESDPTVPSHVKAITQQNITNWNNKQDALTFDNVPTANSTNPVTSGGVKTALDKKLDVIDFVSTCPNLVLELTNGTRVTLSSEALAEFNSLETLVGRIFRFTIPNMIDVLMTLSEWSYVDSESVGENKDYTQFSFLNDTFRPYHNNVNNSSQFNQHVNGLVINHYYEIDNNWNSSDLGEYSLEQVYIDNLPLLVSGVNIKTINHNSLLGSGDISVQTLLTFDTTPTANSTNPVTSGGIKTYVDTALANFDDEIFVPVSTLPTTNIKTNKIYIVPNSLASPENNLYDEYIYKNNAWELIGTSLIDLNGKLDKLISGTNIKTVNDKSLLGSGDVPIIIEGTYYNGVFTSYTYDANTGYTYQLPAAYTGDTRILYVDTVSNVIYRYNGSLYVKLYNFNTDSTPTSGSSNFVTSGGVYNALYKSGTTAQRPTTNLIVGMQYFDTTLGQPIWWNGTAWVDALGNTPGSRNYVYVENN